LQLKQFTVIKRCFH